MTNDTTMDALEKQRKQLKFRAWHRGTREMDFLMGTFADKHVDSFDQAQLDRFAQLIALSDPDLYRWKTGRDPVPEELQHDVMLMLITHEYETGA